MPKTRVFFTTDLHGSEVCFEKFVSAAKFYRADVVIIGGDVTGKEIVPIIERLDGTYEAKFRGREWAVKTKEKLSALEKSIRDCGSYPYRTNPDEMEELSANKDKVDELFLQLMMETLRRWIGIAEKHLRASGIKCFISAGNDDRLEIDTILKGSDYVINPEGKVVNIDNFHEMISTGYSNITPWNCPRDITEEEVAQKIEGMIPQVKNMKNCFFNFHCPPHDSGLDVAPRLDEQLRPVFKAGTVELISVGSWAVRNSIEKYQPLLGLHGHIHESKGFLKIGRTLCLNPGSEFEEGILRGALITLDEKRIKGWMFTLG